MIRKALCSALLVASTATWAGAALWSAPLTGNYHSRLNCRVTNVSSFTRHVTIQIVGITTGSVLANSVLDLAPGKTFSATTPEDSIAFCWVGGIAKSESRITFSAVDDTDFSTITAIQVR